MHDVHLSYGRTRHFDVVLSSCPDEELRQTGCTVYFRVKDASGSKLENADVSSGSWPHAKTDEYGRVRVPLGIGKMEAFTVSLAGYVEKSLEIPCKVPIELERDVVLQK